MNAFPTFKIKCKQTTKGVHSLECTVENTSDKMPKAVTVDDSGDVKFEPLGMRLLSMMQEAEHALRQDGRILAVDIAKGAKA